MWILIILGVVVLPVLPVFAYIEYRRWRGTAVVVQPPLDETNRDPISTRNAPKRLPRLMDFLP